MSTHRWSQIVEYVVVTDNVLHIFEAKVLGKIKDGFTPIGGISCVQVDYISLNKTIHSRVEYYQSMIREQEYSD